jgi:hypothetical protein
MPELASSIFGECQALLLNFDELLEKEFGGKYCIRECLSFSLQLFPSAKSLVDAVKRNPASKPIVEFVQRYRSTVSPEIQASGKYAFKAFLIQVANHQAKNTTPIQFIHYDKLSDEQMKQINQLTAIVKIKQVQVLNLNPMKAGEVVKKKCSKNSATRKCSEWDVKQTSLLRALIPLVGKNTKPAHPTMTQTLMQQILHFVSMIRCIGIMAIQRLG